MFRYVGASTTVDLLTINTAPNAGVVGVVLRDFRVDSTTTMTGGFAIHSKGLYDSQFINIAVDSVNSSTNVSTWGKLCGGLWVDETGGLELYSFQAFSKQNCGDGVRVSSPSGNGAELRLVGGDIGGTFTGGTSVGFVAALHVAGGFGGARCDTTSFHNSGYGILIDNSAAAFPNREIDEGSTCAVDAMVNAGVYINDALASGGTVDIAGWEASTLAGHGVVVHAWANGDVEIRGDKVYNNCGSGVLIDDATTSVNFSPATMVNNNGQSSIGVCTTWKGTHTGHGYGVEASTTLTKTTGAANAFGNALGPANNSVGMAQWLNFGGANGITVDFSNSAGDMTLALDSASTKTSELLLKNNGADKWDLVNSNFGSANQFGILDVANSATAWLQITTGGNAIVGESSGNILTVLGNLKVANVPTSAGSGGLYVCVDSAGIFYKKSSCP